MLELEIGQEVQIINWANGERWGWPEEGYPVTVKTIGRKYFTVEGAFVPGPNSKFSLEDGVINDDLGHYHIKTLEQVELDRREKVAKETLKEHFIELKRGHKYTLEQIEHLAAVVVEIREVTWT